MYKCFKFLESYSRDALVWIGGMILDHSMMFMMCTLMFIGVILSIMVLGATVYAVTRLLMKKIRLMDRPLIVLKERYVRSEINDDEYLRMKKIVNEVK